MAEQAIQQFNFTHRIPNPLTYTAFSQEQSIQIDRLHGIRALCLSAVGAFTAGTNTAVATTEPIFVNDIKLTVGGGTVLFAGDWQGLARLNQCDYGVAPTYTGPAGAAGAVTFVATSFIDMQSVFGRAPIDTALISRLFSSIELRARIGAAADLVSSGDAPGFTSFSIDVTLDEVVNMQQGFGAFVKKISWVEREITSTQTEFVIPLPTGNMIKQVLFRTMQTALPVDTILNNAKIMVGGEVLFDAKAAHIRGSMIARHQMASRSSTGYYLIDFNADRILSDGANLSKVASLGCNLVLDVTKVAGTNLCRAFVTEILPIR